MADEAAVERDAIRKELSRIHESAVLSSQGQFEAAKMWRAIHWGLGALTAALSTTAAVITFASGSQIASGVLAVLAAIAVSFLTGIRPDRLAERAQTSANDYIALRNDARRLRDIRVATDPLAELREALESLAEQAASIDQAADSIPRRGYLLAKRNIEQDGGQSFEVDGE